MPKATAWTAADLPDLSARVCVVTGGNSGIGLETARQLARSGARVVIACRDARKASAAIDEIRTTSPRAVLEALPLDLADLSSVRAFAGTLQSRHSRVDVLCNNAGVMALPYCKTADGFEMQLGTNHLGHFALTGLLLDLLLASPDPRVVTVGSNAHRIGRICFEDLQGERRYSKWKAYGQSKLANLLFAYELAHRAEKAGASLVSVAAHPGYAATNLQGGAARMQRSRLAARIFALGNRLLAQSSAMGALPVLYAAAAPGVRSGDYYGPGGAGQNWGPPRKVASSARSHDREAAARLWDVSTALTGVAYDALGR